MHSDGTSKRVEQFVIECHFHLYDIVEDYYSCEMCVHEIGDLFRATTFSVGM